MTAPLLEVDALVAGHGDAIVVDDVSVRLDAGDTLALIGRNGAGKTTLLVTLMGFARVHRGAVRWRGADLRGRAPQWRARAGLGWVPQERHMWPSLTVDEHLTAVARPGPWDAARVFALFPRLAERRHHFGLQLSGGEQQMLALGRALMTNPALLLLDEPFEGLAPVIVDELARAIRAMATDGGMAVLLVDPHARLAASMCARTLVLERGRTAWLGASADLLADPARFDAWLGAGGG
ncbi:MAG: ABC transporter ATP-binding protein [Burkholderiales bacterium]|nr:ABC transporter ATP-binding protein [Burkholderiales bacterium]